MARNILLHAAYDGTRFVGWQKTNLDPLKFPSIEYELERACRQILSHPVTLQAASRTDRGVHAEEQTVNFLTVKESLDLDLFCYGLNALLPPDIRVKKVFDAPSTSFHATLDSKSKTYRYSIATGKMLHPFCRYTHWHFPYMLDLEKMKAAAQEVVGKHDFRAFQNTRKGTDIHDTMRTVFSIDIEKCDDAITLYITADNFLYKMARNIAGTLAYIGAGKLSHTALTELFQSRNRSLAGITAPACGLTLCKVFY